MQDIQNSTISVSDIIVYDNIIDIIDINIIDNDINRSITQKHKKTWTELRVDLLIWHNQVFSKYQYVRMITNVILI